MMALIRDRCDVHVVIMMALGRDYHISTSFFFMQEKQNSLDSQKRFRIYDFSQSPDHSIRIHSTSYCYTDRYFKISETEVRNATFD